ncbi:ABC transporter ATP-binding protein [Rhodococcus rhodnii]|uniref:ABC lipoprotein transporter n=2 Tax=Rhodococcus rhodnii TaxID=38312 RepID=R7WNS1_9NOCA|nr:ABC transporter ATP-binding protein [Rhodococcus rhodnii]EOM76966.1 ABC lipoprotein transporter [Rhodococcus rhodnii LMG 5362]TXG89948.1 ABC transporter ATP-binding protein [Rhodococcus rhodnii]
MITGGDSPDGDDGTGTPRLVLAGVTKRYERDGPPVLDDLHGVFTASRVYCVLGASGSGKTTFLECASGLSRVSSGTVLLSGIDITTLSDGALAGFRRSDIGFVFQQDSLIESLSLLENVLLPARLARAPMREAEAIAHELLRIVGLDGLAARLPGSLSGGQRQRVGIARALVMRPSVVFADEPTSALDDGSAADVLGLLRDLCVSYDATVVMVTHDPRAARAADEVFELVDGALVSRVRR